MYLGVWRRIGGSHAPLAPSQLYAAFNFPAAPPQHVFAPLHKNNRILSRHENELEYRGSRGEENLFDDQSFSPELANYNRDPVTAFDRSTSI